MYLHGTYYNELNQRIELHILTRGDRSDTVEIGSDESGIFFTDDAVEITSSVNDTFDVLLRSQASVRLLTRNFLSDLFCPDCRDAVVNILRDGVCVFAGFIEPQTYTQGYNEDLDEIELSCIDALTALEYAKYRSIGSMGVLYSVVKAQAGQRLFANLMIELLEGVTASLDITGTTDVHYWYDGSKALPGSQPHRLFASLGINELLFLGETEDDVWTEEEVLTEVLKFLNLHIRQEGMDFYLFDWHSVKSDNDIRWMDLRSGTEQIMPTNLVDIRTAIVADADTTISIGEVYNQLLLTCKVERIESVIESPLESESLVSPYANKQLFMREYSSHGEGDDAIQAFYAILHGEHTDYDAGSITDWYLQVQSNPKWIFKGGSADNLIDVYCRDGRDQQRLPDLLSREPGAAIISIGSVEHKTDNRDNSPVSKIDMTDYLVVSVNGNGKDSESDTYPTPESLKTGIPRATYIGNQSGGVFSPASAETTNYIVISGSIILNPRMEMTDTYARLRATTNTNSPYWGHHYEGSIYDWWHKTVPSRLNEDGRYYTRQWFKAENPNIDPTWDESVTKGFVPFTGTGPEVFEFKYSAIGDETDRVSKIGVLACMLIIGNQCVVEVGNNGTPEDYQWQSYKRREQCADDDEYYAQSFTIGFDPKIGDKLIGTKFDIANNIDYRRGIDAEGTAIPIPFDKHVSGEVRFMILGPVNLMWDDITRRHPTWFRHTKWTTTSKPLLAHVSSVMIEKFEMKVYSDNGLVNNTGDSDIMYLSDTAERFVNKKDDLGMRIHSALTGAECRELGITDSVKMSTPVRPATGEAVLALQDCLQGIVAKAEQLYVDAYYREYHAPRVLMDQALMDEVGNVGWCTRYRHPAMKGKTFFALGIDRNLTSGTAVMHLKEIDL